MSDFNPKSQETYNLLMRRRSVLAKQMIAPAPDHVEIEKILEAGMRVPDHGKIAPWRFVVLSQEDQAAVDAVISEAITKEDAEDKRSKAEGYASQAPLCISVISSPDHQHPVIPVWEQILSAGAVCQNMLIAATALGYASQWLTGWPSYSPMVQSALGLTEGEQIAGLVFLGTQDEPPKERGRPNLEDKVKWGLGA